MSSMGLAGNVLVVALGAASMLVPLVLAFAKLPLGLLAAWPLLLLQVWPELVSIVVGIPAQRRRHDDPCDLPLDAATWLRQRLDALDLRDVAVESCEGVDAGYHPERRAILLAPRHHEWTVEAYGTAAHELGHALFDRAHPRASRLMQVVRFHGRRLFAVAAAALLSASVLGATALYSTILILTVVVALRGAIMVVEELLASRLALQQLALVLPPHKYRQARWDLGLALLTYVGYAAAAATPLLAFDWLIARGAAVDLGPSVGGSTLAAVAAALVLLGAAVRTWSTLRPVPAWLTIANTGSLWQGALWGIALTHGGLPAWTITLGAIAAVSTVVLPGVFVLGWLNRRLGAASSVAYPTITAVTPISPKDLTPAPTAIDAIARLLSAWWGVPLAIAILTRC